MNDDIYRSMAELLTARFEVPAERLAPTATLEDLGLDSLSLMEFVFAVEDLFHLRIPEDQLDPRQGGITLSHISELVAGMIARGTSTAAAAA